MKLLGLLSPDLGISCLPLIQQCLNTPTGSEIDFIILLQLSNVLMMYPIQPNYHAVSSNFSKLL